MWDKIQYDMGQLQLGETVEGKFVYGGNDKLITRVSTSCGCTAAKSEPTEDGKQYVSFTYNAPSSFTGRGDKMNLSKAINVRFEDGTVQGLSIKGYILKNG